MSTKKTIGVIYAAIIAIMLSGCSDGKEEYDHATSVRRVLKVQQLQNLQPRNPAVVPQMQAIVDSMGAAGRDACYYGAINVLIDRLFSDGRYAEADSLAVRMQVEARTQNDSIAIAMAKRVRAQIYFKLSQPYKAMAEIEDALPYIEHPIQTPVEFSTSTSIYEWQHIIATAQGDTEKANKAGMKYASITGNKSISSIWSDTTGHFPATALAFRAEDALSKGNLSKATMQLDSAQSYIHPSLPARAYEHLYRARAKVRTEQEYYPEALTDVDTLLVTHRSFPWFYLQDLLLKAEILNRAGRHEESSNTYSQYIAYHDSLSSLLTDRRLHDLTVLYRSEIDREQKRIHTIRQMSLGGISILFLLLFGLTLRHAITERKKNRLLVEQLHEYDRLHPSMISESVTDKPTRTETDPIHKLDCHMLQDRPYTNPGLGRKELAEYMGMPQDSVAQLIRKEKGMSVHSYINSWRIEEARRCLDNDTEEPIAEIAARLGFGTSRTLQRAFREKYDMTPTQYRTASKSVFAFKSN